jgi:hypothetical protein
MKPLSPEARAALLAAIRPFHTEANKNDERLWRYDEAIWRAACAWQAEQDAKVCDDLWARYCNGDDATPYAGAVDCAAAIREQIKP